LQGLLPEGSRFFFDLIFTSHGVIKSPSNEIPSKPSVIRQSLPGKEFTNSKIGPDCGKFLSPGAKAILVYFAKAPKASDEIFSRPGKIVPKGD
jgi:hypothetical protein